MSAEGIFRVSSPLGLGPEIQRVIHERAPKMKRQMRTDLQGKTTLLCTRVTVSHTGSDISNVKILIGLVQPAVLLRREEFVCTGSG